MQNILGLWILIFLAVAVMAWAEVGVTPTEIRLGMVNAQSGPASGLGRDMRIGAEAVFREVNRRGGIHGRRLVLLVADDGYEPYRAIDQTLAMIEEQQVFALFGYVGTPTANAIIPIVQDLQVPLIGLFTGAMSLRQPVIPQIINIRASYNDEAERLVEYYYDLGFRKFAVFYQDDGFGLAVLEGTEIALAKRGLEVVAQGTFQRNTTAVKTGLAVLLKAKPEVVIMVGPYAPLASFIRSARQEGMKSQLATVSFVGTGSLVAQVGEAGEGVLISQVVPFPEDLSLPITRECADLLQKSFSGEQLGFVNLEGCITAKALVSALERVGTNPNRQKLIEAFERMRKVDVGGLLFTLGTGDHQASDQVFLTRIINGRIGQLPQVSEDAARDH